MTSTENPSGLLFFTSENVINNVSSSFDLMIDQIDYMKDKANASVDINFYCTATGNSNSTYFILQILGNVSDLKVNFGGNEVQNKTVYYYDLSGTSYIIAKLPKLGASHIELSIGFTWKDMFQQRSFSEFDLIVPFSNAFPPYIHQISWLPTEAINYDGILFLDETGRTKLSVATPWTATFSGLLPNPDAITFYTNRIWHIWDMKERINHTQYVSSVVSIGVSDDSLKTVYEQSLAYFLLLLGIGIPTVISSLIELIKLSYENHNMMQSTRKTDREPANQSELAPVACSSRMSNYE